MDFSGATPSLQLSTIAQAQTFSDADVTNYARAVLTIEQERAQLPELMEQATGSRSLPSIRCTKEGIQAIGNGDARRVAINFCNKSVEIVQTYLGPNGYQRFEAITEAIQGSSPLDPDLKRRVDKELIRLRQ